MDAHPHTPSPASVHDRRIPPRGVLPRRVQTWIMAGLALLIVIVIVLTGHPEPPPSTSLATSQVPPAPAPPERIRSFQRELAESEPRVVAPPEPLRPDLTMTAAPLPSPSATVDPVADARRQREDDSLFADNVAFSTRMGTSSAPSRPNPAGQVPAFPWPSPQDVAAFQQALAQPASAAGSGQDADPGPPSPATSDDPRPVPSSPDETLNGAAGHRILEGTVIETVLLNRLDGTFSGPVTCLVTTPLYSQDRQVVVIPPGARLLGSAAPVQSWGDARLAISFHRLVLPNGRTVSLDQFQGLNQVGETGLQDRVDRHYLQVFGASLAVGAIAGLGQWGTRGGFNASVGDAARQSAGASLADSTARIMDRYLNVLPTITIREGHRIKVYLTNDLTLPAFAAVADAASTRGGVS